MARRYILLSTLCLAFAVISHGGEARKGAEHPHGPAAGPQKWSFYYDPATGTGVEYPSGIFSTEDTPPKPGLGRRFRTPEGRASLTIYALPKGGDTAWSYLKKHLAIGNQNLDYKRVTSRFFAISGVKQGQTFYSRCNFAPAPRSHMHCILLEYPAEENRAWDDIVTRISLSLHAGRASLASPERSD